MSSPFPSKDYMVHPSLTQLNGASYGASVRPLYNRRLELLMECEGKSDVFYRAEIINRWRESREAMGEIVNADPNDIVFVANATTGTYTALQSAIRVAKARGATGTTIVYYSSVYGACGNQITSLVVNDSSVNSVRIELNDTVGIKQTHDDFVRLTEKAFDALDRTKQAVLFTDHITSGSGLVMPLERLSALCRRFNVLMIVDGAHAIGQVSIDFARLDVDFYTSNLHKWCFVPRSCAFLYAKKLHQAYTHPVLVSHGYHTDFVTRFVQQGTKDDTCWQLVAPMAQYVRTSLGGFDAVWQYERALAARIAARLEHAWRRPMAFDAGHRAAMLLAELPDALHAAVLRLGRDGGGNQLSGKHAYGVMSYLYHQHSVVAPVLCWGQRLYVRICVMPFNVLDDVERLISGIDVLCTLSTGDSKYRLLDPDTFVF